MNKIFESVETNRVVLPVEGQRNSDVLFLAGALKAAQNTPIKIRQKIMSDILSVTTYSATELSFLFSDIAQNDPENQIYDFPDSERRRQFIRSNGLRAAE